LLLQSIVPFVVRLPYLSTTFSVTRASLPGSVDSGVVCFVVTSGSVSDGSVDGVVEGNVSGPKFIEQDESKTAPEINNTDNP
jgi:hypothetical protein